MLDQYPTCLQKLSVSGKRQGANRTRHNGLILKTFPLCDPPVMILRAYPQQRMSSENVGSLAWHLNIQHYEERFFASPIPTNDSQT